MFSLFLHDRQNGRVRLRVGIAENAKLGVEVSQNDPFHGDGCRGDRGWSKKAGNRAEDITPDATQVIATAPRFAAALKLTPKEGAMSFLVSLKLAKLAYERGRTQTTSKHLAPVYVDRAVLAGMIDLENAVSERFTRLESCG